MEKLGTEIPTSQEHGTKVPRRALLFKESMLPTVWIRINLLQFTHLIGYLDLFDAIRSSV